MYAYQLTAPALRLCILLSASRAVLYCAGEIDLANIHRLEEALKVCLDGAAADVEVNLREVRFLDSCTLDALDRAGCRLLVDGRRLKVSAEERVARLFRLTRLGQYLVPCPPSAISAAAAGQPSDRGWPGVAFAAVRRATAMPVPRVRVARRAPHPATGIRCGKKAPESTPRLLRIEVWERGDARGAGTVTGWHPQRRIH